LPDGSTVVARLTANTTASGDRRYSRSFSGSTRTTIVRWLPPNGGGADTPGSVAKMGLTRLSAMSCISGTVRVVLEKTSCATGTLPASNRMMKGGTAPGGMKARARLT
jgi:hypothetical protein